MPSLSTLLLFCPVSLALIVVPGPAVVYIATRSVEGGRAAGLVSMLGVETGTFVHALAATLGVSALIASSAAAFDVVKYAGAAYLVLIGLRKLLRAPGQAREARVRPHSRLYVQGVLVQILNPKVAVFFLAFLPQFVDTSRGTPALQTLTLGVVFTVLAVLSDGTYALVAAGARGWLSAEGAPRRRLERLSGAVYVALGALAALTGSRPARTT